MECFVENVSLKKQVLLLEEVQKLNRENAEKSGQPLTSRYPDLEAGVPPKDEQPDTPTCSLVDYLREDTQVAVAEKLEVVEAVSEEEYGEKVKAEATIAEKKPEPVAEGVVNEIEEDNLPEPEEKKEEVGFPDEEVSKGPEFPAALKDEIDTIVTR